MSFFLLSFNSLARDDVNWMAFVLMMGGKRGMRLLRIIFRRASVSNRFGLNHMWLSFSVGSVRLHRKCRKAGISAFSFCRNSAKETDKQENAAETGNISHPKTKRKSPKKQNRTSSGRLGLCERTGVLTRNRTR